CQEIFHLGRAVQCRVRDDDVSDVDREEENKEQHRHEAVQEEQAEPGGIEEVIGGNPRRIIRPDRKTPEHNNGTESSYDVRGIELRRAHEDTARFKAQNMKNLVHHSGDPDAYFVSSRNVDSNFPSYRRLKS